MILKSYRRIQDRDHIVKVTIRRGEGKEEQEKYFSTVTQMNVWLYKKFQFMVSVPRAITKFKQNDVLDLLQNGVHIYLERVNLKDNPYRDNIKKLIE